MAIPDRTRAVLAMLPFLLAGCTASPRSELSVGRDLTVVTYVVGQGCRAIRGSAGNSDGEQAAAADADVAAGDGHQQGAAASLLASDVGCE